MPQSWVLVKPFYFKWLRGEVRLGAENFLKIPGNDMDFSGYITNIMPLVNYPENGEKHGEMKDCISSAAYVNWCFVTDIYCQIK